MKAEHTKGPWAHRNGRIFQVDNENLTIANVARAFDGDYSHANGYLLAAAPELLEALEDLMALAEEAMLRANYDGGEYDIEAELGDARAAIRKARGESHD